MAGVRGANGSPAGKERRYYHPQQKDYATFLQTSEETGRERTLIEVEVAPGGGNIPHFHKTYDEHFEVLEGTRGTTSTTPQASRQRSSSSCGPAARGSRKP
jgi:mannose-6-phosphate isomerase-like protein (cupin superfamily)